MLWSTIRRRRDRIAGAGLACRPSALPATWMMRGPGGGVIQTTASDSTHTALVVGRHLKADNAPLDNIVAYTSSQSHSSIEKGARVAGYGHIRSIDVDASLAMDPTKLESAIAADLTEGLVPAFVCSTVGPPGPPPSIRSRQSARCRRHGLWHHGRDAFAGSRDDLSRVPSVPARP